MVSNGARSAPLLASKEYSLVGDNANGAMRAINAYLLRRQPERVPPHRVQHVVALRGENGRGRE